jgi:hypothetical protein
MTISSNPTERYRHLRSFLLCSLCILSSLPITSQASTILPTSSTSGFSSGPSLQAVESVTNIGGSDDLKSIIRGFTTQVIIGSNYNTNIFQQALAPGVSSKDLITTVGGVVNYMSKASTFTIGGFYRGIYNEFNDNSLYSAFNQGGGIVMNYTGGRLASTFRAGMDYEAGSNRDFLGALITRTSYSTAVNTRYLISPKAILEGTANYNFVAVEGGPFGDTESYDFTASGLWKYSPLTEFGPGIRYTYRSVVSNEARTAIGPILSVNYRFSQKVSINSRYGVDFSSYESGATVDPTLTASIGAVYNASKLWSMNLTLFRDTQAEPAIANVFNEITSVRLGYLRNIRRVEFRCGLSYDVLMVNNSSSGNGIDRDFVSLDSSLGMPFFDNSYFCSIAFRYANQTASIQQQTWDSTQIGLNISKTF